MKVKDAVIDEITLALAAVERMIRSIEQANANLHNIPESYMFNRETTRQHNDMYIDMYRAEIIELEDLRDGHITVGQLGTARRFFNRLPDWATYGT